MATMRSWGVVLSIFPLLRRGSARGYPYGTAGGTVEALWTCHTHRYAPLSGRNGVFLANLTSRSAKSRSIEFENSSFLPDSDGNLCVAT